MGERRVLCKGEYALLQSRAGELARDCEPSEQARNHAQSGLSMRNLFTMVKVLRLGPLASFPICC